VLRDTLKHVKDAERIGDTPFSDLYHQARTSSPQTWGGVAAPVWVEENGVRVEEAVTTRRGEHYRHNAADMVVSLPVKPFMVTATARNGIVRSLRLALQHETANARQ